MILVDQPVPSIRYLLVVLVGQSDLEHLEDLLFQCPQLHPYLLVYPEFPVDLLLQSVLQFQLVQNFLTDLLLQFHLSDLLDPVDPVDQ